MTPQSRVQAEPRAHMGPAAMLASVTGPAEALLAAALGADILDAKDPSAGALGRLPL